MAGASSQRSSAPNTGDFDMSAERYSGEQRPEDPPGGGSAGAGIVRGRRPSVLVPRPATYVRHERDRPIAITWRCTTRLPADLYTAFAAAVA